MKFITSCFAVLTLVSLFWDHVRPCRRLDQSVANAVNQGNYQEALQTAHRLLDVTPCLCLHRAESGLTSAYEQSVAALIRSDDSNVSLGLGIADLYKRLASEHGIVGSASTAHLTAALVEHDIQMAMQKANRGQPSTALGILDEVEGIRLPDELEVRHEIDQVRFVAAQQLARAGASEAAFDELKRILETQSGETTVRDDAQQLAASVSGNLLSRQLRSHDFRGALAVMQEARQIVLDNEVEGLYDVFDEAAYGRRLRGSEIGIRLDPGGEVSSKLRIRNESKNLLYVLLRGPSLQDVVILGGQDKSIELKPGRYVVGAYLPKDATVRAYRGMTDIREGQNFSGFVQSSATGLEPTKSFEN
jgi:hypothetical protein